MAATIRAGTCALFLGFALSVWAAAESPARPAPEAAAPPRRWALLIGNSKYQNLNQLKNPTNDVDKMASKLDQLGFLTSVLHDLDHQHFADSLGAFSLKIVPGDIALFYYSGHGVQLQGTDYLIPVDMPAGANATVLKLDGIPLPYVRGALDASKLSLIILDACRTIANFPAKGPTNGLTAYASRGALIAFAADEGQAALDNDNENVSLFTKHLIQELDKPDETLCEFFGGVRQAVDLASQHVQFPFVYDGVIGDFVFNPTRTEESRKLSELSNKVGPKKVWAAIQNSGDPYLFAAYLEQPADTKHRDLAAERFSSLLAATLNVTGVVTLVSDSSPDLVYIANQGQRLYYERAYAEAAKTYFKLVESSPATGPALYNYATCLLRLARYDEAIQLFSKAAEIAPQFPWAYYNRGVAYHLKGNLKEAIDSYSRALELRPGYAPVYNNLALAKRDARDLTGAVRDAEAAIKIDPQYRPAVFNYEELSATLKGAKEPTEEQMVEILRKGNNNTANAALDSGGTCLQSPIRCLLGALGKTILRKP